MAKQKSKVRPPRPDQLWKAIIEDLWDSFLWYFFPDYAPLVDFSRPPEFMDKELASLAPPGRSRGRVADKLMKVWLLDGSETWVLVHVEVQGNPEPDFARRMAQMGYRIFDRHGVRPVALAILTDDSPVFRPLHFEVSTWGQALRYEFHTYKIADHPPQTDGPPSNPFALVTEAAYYSLRKLKLDDEGRLTLKGQLLQKLVAAGYERKIIYHLLIFVRHIPRFLDPGFLPIFEATIDTLTQTPAAMSTFELELDYRFRLGVEQGIEQGMEQGVEQGIEQGVEQGIKRGEQIRLEKVILTLLSKGFSPQQIHDMLDVPMEKIEEAISKHQQGEEPA